ncbi:hypothetical protein C8J56DRAFT_916407 [Mycena floridula]|nr:hypothetical protein C8J56DRAFT_916407 [Mycena floridula]
MPEDNLDLVSLEALITSVDDLQAPLEKHVLINNCPHMHRIFEYRWGLNLREFDESHERNIIYVRKSMRALLGRGWTLVPTEDTLTNMREMQAYNESCPLSERKNFLAEFSAPEYEYMFFPVKMQEDIIVDGKRYSAPYSDFPRIKCSVNAFFCRFSMRRPGPSFNLSNIVSPVARVIFTHHDWLAQRLSCVVHPGTGIF